MSFKATDLAFQIILNDQKLDFAVLDKDGAALAQGKAATCGPTNQKGPYGVKCKIGFSDKGNFERLREALNVLMEKMNKIDAT